MFWQTKQVCFIVLPSNYRVTRPQAISDSRAQKPACLRNDIIYALIQIERAVDTGIVALGYESVDFEPVTFGIEKVTGNRISHYLVRMTNTVVDGDALSL